MQPTTINIKKKNIDNHQGLFIDVISSTSFPVAGDWHVSVTILKQASIKVPETVTNGYRASAEVMESALRCPVGFS
jgi:hypothetical protein